jgi:L-lactate dehydrogenase complex protein LldG
MSREAILGGIRRGLRRGPVTEDTALLLRARLALHRRQLIPARSQVARPAQVSLFLKNLEAVFGSYTRVADAASVPQAVSDFLAGHNLPFAVAIAPHPELRDIPWSERPLLALREGKGEAADLVAIQHGWGGIAETGTLMLPAGPERPTTLNLLADTAIVVLRASRVFGAYEEAWDALRAERVGRLPMPRNIMMVTGPSRSADIESTLELGAHGPRRLHVVLIDDDPGAIELAPEGT